MIIDKNILTIIKKRHIIMTRGEKMKKSFIAKIVEIVLIFIFIIGIVTLPFIPKLYNIFKDSSVPGFNSQTFIYKIAFYLCYIICIFIVFKMFRLFNMIYKESPFKKEIENSLKMMAIMFMTLFVIIIIKTIFIPTLLSYVVCLLCFLVSLSFYILAEVIKAAINYKNEVDFTV